MNVHVDQDTQNAHYMTHEASSAHMYAKRAKYDPRTFTDYSNVEEQIDDDY